MKNQAFQFVVGVAAGILIVLTGCATVTVDKDRMDKVKTVAIVGFSGQIALKDPKEKESGGIMGSINAIKTTSEMASGEFGKRRSDQAEQVYSLLTRKLEEGLGWRVLERAALAQNGDYARLLADNPAGGLTSGYGEQILPNILREETAKKFDDGARARLAKSLGVDAIAVAHVKYVVGDKSGFSVGGMGKITKYPKAIVTFTVYDAASPDPAWKDAWAEGKPTKEGLETTMGVDVDAKETTVLVAAADSGFSTLVARYQERVGKN